MSAPPHRGGATTARDDATSPASLAEDAEADPLASPESENLDADEMERGAEDDEELDPHERAMAKREREEARHTDRRGTALDSSLDDDPVR